MANTVKDILTKIDEATTVLIAEVEDVKTKLATSAGDQAAIDEAIAKLDNLKTRIANVSEEVQGGGTPGTGTGTTPDSGTGDGTTPAPGTSVEDIDFLSSEDDE